MDQWRPDGKVRGNNHVLMDQWRPDEKVRGNQTWFWGAISFPSVSVKDRSLLIPLVMLNACLIFSWPNKVPFDREASGIIRVKSYTGARIGAAGVWRGCEEWAEGASWLSGGPWVLRLQFVPRRLPRYYHWWSAAHFSGWVWFVWGINHQLVRNRFESPSLSDSEHLTRVMAS
jgi:hypothetical protein